MKNNYIIGLNIYHADSSACIMKNGEIIFAIEEERVNRIKHWAGFPIKSIKACLNYANISLDEVSYIAINSNPISNIFNKALYSLKNFRSYKFFLNRLILKHKKISFKKLLIEKFNIKNIPTVKYYDHHLCHISSAYYPSKQKKSLLISADGFGDFASTMAAVGINNNINVKNKILFPHSLGIFYQAFTQFLGFKNYGDEYKVMGLSAYGLDKFKKELDEVIKIKNGSFNLNLNFFQHHKKNISMQWNDESPKFANLYSENLSSLFKFDLENKEITQIHMDLAKSVQIKYEEAIISYIKYYKNKFDIDNLCLSGGCAMNSLANGVIVKELNFKDIYIPPAPGDAGGAIGAAILCDKEYFQSTSSCYSSPYLGNDLKKDNLEEIIKKNIQRINLNENIIVDYIENDQDLVDAVAQSIFKNKVVGWFQDRMEWGPRALGNRSILANPCSEQMKNIINLKIKRREKFRPFAPSILREYTSDWFEIDIDVPYMGIVLKIKEDKRKKLPAVAHFDGTGRLQTVDKEKNKLYYMLINSFKKISGVPILLNTSFNENEPIVNTIEEALNCFLRTKMDVLVIGNFVLKR